MTRLVAKRRGATTMWSYLYGLAAPATGAHNIVISASESTVIRGASASYTGAKQTGQPDATGTGEATPGTTVTAAVTVVASNCWLIGGITDDGANAVTAAGALTTNRATDGNNVTIISDSNGQVGTGTQNATWTFGSQNVAATAISLIDVTPPATATGGNFRTLMGVAT